MRLDGLMLWVSDVPATVRYYREAFGVEPRWVRDEGDYAQMETGEVVLQFAGSTAAPTTGVDVTISSPGGSAPGVQLAFVTDDVAAAMRRAVEAGGSEVAAPVTKPWGQVVGYVRDVNGFLVEIATSGD